MAAFLIGQPDPRFEPPPQQVSTAATHRAGLNQLPRYGIRPEPQLDQTGTRGTRRNRARSACTLRGSPRGVRSRLDDRIRVNGRQQHIMGAAADLRLMQLVRCQLKAPGTLGLTPHPHMLRHTFVTTTLDAGVDLRDVQIAAGTPTHAQPCATTGRARTSTAIPTTSSPPTWPLEHDRRARPTAPSCRKSDVRCVEPTCATLRARCSCGLALLPSSCAKGPLAKIQSAATAAIALISRSAPGTARPATRAAVTSGGAPARASRGAIAP